jgi:hypothetical protein
LSPDSRPVPSRFQRWTDTAHLVVYVGVLAVVTITALVLAVVAQNKATHVAQSQSQQLRDVVCDAFTDIGTSPITPDVRPLGRKIIADTKRGAEVAKCPPPPRPSTP